MSAMCCHFCGRIVDTDDDPDSLYVLGYDDRCVCEACRDERELRTELDEEELRA